MNTAKYTPTCCRPTKLGSIEKVNPNLFCEGENNWRASNANIGGTPGKVNSVFGESVVIADFRIIKAIITDSNKVQVYFNKSLDSLGLIDGSMLEVNGISPILSTPISPFFNSVNLIFGFIFLANNTYTLTANNLMDCSGNLLSNSMIFGLPDSVLKNDIVINEVLFNPKDDGVDYVEIYNNSNSFFDLSKLIIGNFFLFGTQIEPVGIKEIIESFNPDFIFHLAALIAIPYSYQAPTSYVDTNVQGTLNVLQAALDKGVSRVVHTSTSEVYGTACYVPIDEKHPLQAQSPYSASKIGADSLAYSYFNSFNLPVVIARPFNTYGPRQSARALIPTVMTQLLMGLRRIKLGNLSPTRDFNFVHDTCRGFLALAECDAAIGKAINIGSGQEVSIGDTVQLIARLMEVDVEIECEQQRLRPGNSEVERLLCDNSLITSLTRFKPIVGLEDGLASTLTWLKEPSNLSRYKVDMFNV